MRKRMPGDFRPSRDDLLRYIDANPDLSGKRDLAKAFGLKGPDRIWLKDVLSELADEGPLALLLHLYEKDAAVRLLEAG